MLYNDSQKGGKRWPRESLAPETNGEGARDLTWHGFCLAGSIPSRVIGWLY